MPIMQKHIQPSSLSSNSDRSHLESLHLPVEPPYLDESDSRTATKSQPATVSDVLMPTESFVRTEALLWDEGWHMRGPQGIREDTATQQLLEDATTGPPFIETAPNLSNGD